MNDLASRKAVTARNSSERNGAILYGSIVKVFGGGHIWVTNKKAYGSFDDIIRSIAR